MKFNEKLIMFRKEKGMSQENLGEKLDVTRQTISKWELGETTPEMDKLIRMSELFETTVDNLIKDKQIEIDNKQKDINSSNTQKLAGILIFIIKTFGILFIISFIFMIIGIVFFSNVKNTKSEVVNKSDKVVIENKVEENE